jgi:hypothetical protein
MTTPLRIKLFTLALLTTSALTLRADTLSGSYSNDCSGLVKLWDVSGVYAENNGIENESITLDMDEKGILTGTGRFNLSDSADSVSLDGDATVSGKVSSAGSVTRVKLTLQVTSGTGTVQGTPITFLATLNENFELDDVDRMLVGRASGKLKLTVPSVGKSRTLPIPPGSVMTDLPDGVDGAWGLTLDAAPDGIKVGGTSALQLSNGKTVQLNAAGTYSTKSDVSKVSLKSADGSKSVTLSITGQSAANNLSILSIKGKALGQKLKFAQ